MLLYFVRHGQTPSNKEWRYQTFTTPLSPEGEVQAAKLAERLKDVPFQEIWSSPMTRARQTADIINNYHHLEIKEFIELREIKRATILEGKLSTDPSIKHIQELLEANKTNYDFKYAEGESFAEFVNRAHHFITLLEKYYHDTPTAQADNYTMCITAHGLVLNIVLVSLLIGTDVPIHIYDTAFQRFHMDNTAISMVEFNSTWRVITLNDFAHL